MVQQTDPLPGLERVDATKPEYQIFRLIWDKLSQLRSRLAGPVTGTLNPDTRPRLTAKDSGARFFATDFNREYTWSGTAWADSPTAPSRFQVTFFMSTPEPSVGWVKCNGASTFRSTSDGRTLYFQTPTIAQDASGNVAYVRV